MDVCRALAGRSSKFVKPAMTLLIVSAAACGMALAQEKPTGGPTPSAPGAEVYFSDLKDGATIPPKATIRFGLREMGVAPAGSDRANSGHHHLLIDTELPPLDKPIPNDFNHLHFGTGQTEAEVTLKPGPHTLQLLLGDKDHIPHNPPVMSSRIQGGGGGGSRRDGRGRDHDAPAQAGADPYRAAEARGGRAAAQPSRLPLLLSRLSLLLRLSALPVLLTRRRKQTRRYARADGRAARFRVSAPPALRAGAGDPATARSRRRSRRCSSRSSSCGRCRARRHRQGG